MNLTNQNNAAISLSLQICILEVGILCNPDLSCSAFSQDSLYTCVRRFDNNTLYFLARGYILRTMKLVATLLAVLTVRTAAKTAFLSEPTVLWQTAVSPVGEGNECAFSPTSNPTLVCTAIDGSATALQPESATTSDVVWNYMPEAVGTMSSTSGVTFSSTGSWFVYATTDITSTRTVWYVVIRDD